jgi:Tfp pilus assembly protein PilN
VSVGDLNLARRPFVNGRPVTRLAVLLSLLALLLFLGNVYVYVSYVSGTGEKRAELDKVERQKANEERRIRELSERFARLDLASQNEQVDFLNEKIAERTFSWSQLFDRLSRLMPADVRLTRLSPHGVVDAQADRRRRGAPPPLRKKGQDDRVTLTIVGEAKSDAALLKFIDNLFSDATFLDPNLLQQTKEANKDVIKFDLRVGYLPRGLRVAPASPPPAGRRPAAPSMVRRSRPLTPLASTGETAKSPGVPHVGTARRRGAEGGEGR